PPGPPPGRRRFARTAAWSSSVRMPRLRLSKGGSLTPPSRVVKAAWAPRIVASSHRTPSRSRHSITSAYPGSPMGRYRDHCSRFRPIGLALGGRGEGDGELLLAVRGFAVEGGAAGGAQGAAERRPLRNAGRQQGGAVDLERHRAPLAQV